MQVKALAQWYGSNRKLGEHVGALLKGCNWIGVPFCGGLSELVHIQCRTGVANDLHRHLINLARVAAHPWRGAALWRRLRRFSFHPDTLADAQALCRQQEEFAVHPDFIDPEVSLSWAEAYFLCCWLTRAGDAGTDSEFKGKLSFRWEAGGGDSVKRWRGAIDGLREWRQILSRWTFDCRDAFEFLEKCKDAPGHGLYVDAPWPSDGDGYRHKFGEDQQRRLASVLAEYQQTRVVVRFGDHPLIRELYPESDWTWNMLTGRTAANKAKAEVLLVRNAA